MNTNLYKEIGGYFELECARNIPYHKNGILLNSAGNALRCIIRTYHIQNLHVPYYTCPVVWQAVASENCHIIPYDTDHYFMPLKKIDSQDFILYNNYFGICGKNVQKLAKIYPNLIVDNAQSFYYPKMGLASFYSPRKFFGVPDGGILLCNQKITENFKQSVSYNLCSHLLKRWDLSASDGYSDFQKNNDALVNRPIEYMSKLTRALMGNIDYERVKKIRLENFNFLHETLKKRNQLKIDLSPEDVPMVYPFKTNHFGLRQQLIQNKIYIAKYWPRAENCSCMSSQKAQELAHTIIPLPLDQRYGLKDMKLILEFLENAKN